LRGQPLEKGIFLDDCYDTVYIDCHFWLYWSLNENVRNYTLANLTTLQTGRVDGLYLHNFFTIHANIGWKLVNNGTGVVQRGYANLIYCDLGTRGVVIDSTADGCYFYASQLTCYGFLGSPSNPATANSYGLTVASDNNRINISYADFEAFGYQAIYLDGTGNSLQIDSPYFANYAYRTGETAGIVNIAGNEIIFNGKVSDNPLPGRTLFSANTGLVNSVDQWVSYAPTITTASGTITTLGSVSAFYLLHGNTVTINFYIPITTNGTGAGTINMSLPINVKAGYYSVGTGRETVNTGNQLSVEADSGGSVATIRTYNNLYPGSSGAILVGTVSYVVD
jgi:hypothetical protein